MGRKATADDALPRELAEARFSGLYRDHEREILRYALRRSGEAEDAADVVAETFLSPGGGWPRSHSAARSGSGSTRPRAGCWPTTAAG